MNKISYALGLGIAQQLKSMGIEDFSVEDFSQSVSDILSGKTPAMPCSVPYSPAEIQF